MAASGSAGPVSGPPTIYDVAQRASVSIATVSRVLNGRGYLRPETRERVLQSVRDLHFVPNEPARQLSSRTKKVIGLAFVRPPEDEMSAVEEDSLLFTDAVIRGAELAAQRCGYSLLLTGVSEGDSAQEVTALTGKADGVIILDRVLPEWRVAALAERSPVVLLSGSGHSQGAVNVRVDNVEGMQAIAQHLINDHGLRRFAFMAGKEESPDSTTREEAFTEMVGRLGGVVEPSEEGWSADWTTAGAIRATRNRLASARPLPEAIVCASDPMAIGVIQALHAAGLRVPDEVSVTGFDDIPIARHLTPSLTTVRQPSQQLGSVSVEALIGLIEDLPNAQGDRVLPTRLVVRASCGCPPPSSLGRSLLDTQLWGTSANLG
jgi:LacI family transcriptional regulator